MVKEYKLTTAGKKLFQVLIDPENIGKNIIELCETAGVSRDTYYRLMRDDDFSNLVQQTAREMVISNTLPVVNAAVRFAQEERGHQDRKMILTMSGLYTDKQDTTVHGHINISDKADLIQKYLFEDDDKVISNESERNPILNKYLNE